MASAADLRLDEEQVRTGLGGQLGVAPRRCLANRKLVPFEEAAPGLIGLETALSLGLAAVAAGRLTLATLVAALTTRPATIIGEARGLDIGASADLVLFDAGARWRVEESALASASSNTPLLGMDLPGVVRLTVADGRITYRG